MVRRTISNAAVLAAALVPLGLSSCSDDTSSGVAGGSGGAPAKDGETGDTSDAFDAGPTLPDGSIPPGGTRLVPGRVTLAGVTSDNYAVYGDDTARTLHAISLAGGSPATLGTSHDSVVVRGSVVVSWVGTARVSPLTVWTAAHGSKNLSMASNANPAAVAVSPDGAHILYFDDVDPDRTRGNLFIAGTDGTGQKQLAESIALSDPTCVPVLAFGGNAAAAAAFCIAPSVPDDGPSDASTTDVASPDADTADAASPDTGTEDAAPPDAGSTPMAMVQSYSGASWAATTLATNVEPRVAIAPTGTTVLVTAPAGLLAYPVAGGAATTIDAAGGTGTFTNDGLSVIYTTPEMALKRSTVTSPSPTTLAASGFGGLRAKSPDEGWLLGYTTIDTRLDLSDLYLASATVAGTPTILSTAVTAGLFGLDGFTADSSHALYYTDIVSGLVGTFNSITPPGGPAVTLGTNAWLHHTGTGSKVVFNDNYDQATHVADIRVADTAQSAPPAIVVSLADADFFVTGTKDKIVYTWKYLTGSMAGLWVAPIP